MKKTLLFVILTIIALALLPAASVASETGQKITVGNYIITYDPGEPVIVNNVSYDDRGVPAEGIVFFNKNKSLFGLISLEKYDPQANLTDKMVKGMEDSGTWQHVDLEIHADMAVAYAIWHYHKICGDKEFLYHEGIEMLLQICRFMASAGGWSPQYGDFGFYGVMGRSYRSVLGSYQNGRAGSRPATSSPSKRSRRTPAPPS